MDDDNGVADAGAQRRHRAQGEKHAVLQQSLVDIDPEVALWSDDFVFGRVWAGEDLSWEQQMLVAITALAALGNHAQLRNYLHGALQGGVSEGAVRQALSMLTVYAGFPVGIQALNVLKAVLDSESKNSSG
ncbi:carboxymuconolactone decarboxylase family protein [Mycolicibacterium sp.]|uniref:carboxymuconolactone decarboxylase family protein n=1 Tax=Mycolicibacterium sp. TaxID=2320850 RepID=UPI001A34A2D3|nr:carboxymuconolactone decarboxylase family protein [Mycolicibacterium sp.]MBJ7336758.1 carboxymuconolactone decarboxylase family protein [Mycolicibacterium sp.]